MDSSHTVQNSIESEIGLGTGLVVCASSAALLDHYCLLVSRNLLHLLKRQFNLEQESRIIIRCRPALLRPSALQSRSKSGSRDGSVKMRLDWLDKKG